MRRFLKRVVEKLYAPMLLRYLKRDRYYKSNGIKLLVKQGVFHPGFFFSTHFLWKEASHMPLQNKTLLELGAGSGFISFSAARAGAIVTASDISPAAIAGLNRNKQTLQLPIHIVESNLFDGMPAQTFDYIMINPPYYPKNARNAEELAWFCGSNFEYFHALFNGLKRFMHRETRVLLSLSEDCNLQRIRHIALEHQFELKIHKKKRILWEQNYIFRIEQQHAYSANSL